MSSITTSAPETNNNGAAAMATTTTQVTSAQRKSTGGLSHIRALGRQRRALLTQGPVVQFVDQQGEALVEGKQAVQMPLFLFNAISSKPELVVDGKVTVPADLNLPSVKMLISCMNLLPTLPRVQDLAPHNNTLRDVHLCSAADALGMGTFTQRMFDIYFKRFNSVVPNAANINAITGIRTPQGDKLFNQMAYTIAKKLWTEDFENGEAFKQNYLPTNPRLATAVGGWVAKFESKAARQADYEKRQAAREKRERKAAEEERRYKEWEVKRAASNKEKEAAVAKKKEEEATKFKAAGESYREKKRRGVKVFTFAEAQYAYKNDGVRVPVKAG